MIQISKIRRYFIAITNSASSFIQNSSKGVRLLIATVSGGILGFSLAYLLNYGLVIQGIKLILTADHFWTVISSGCDD